MTGKSRAYVKGAIRDRAFGLVYQPILHLDTGTVAGVEALCRFHDGASSALWFGRCEALGLAGAMDLAILEKAVEDVERLPPGYLSLNLSAATLSTPGPLQDRLQPILERTPVVLELTEHAMVDDYDAIVGGLRLLRDQGVLLAVDDAGAGYSTFQHILRLRPEIIKLDRSITNGIDANPAQRALTHALVIFAAEIQASVIAEGIETADELNALRMAGVTLGQGYLLARPNQLPLPDIEYRPTPFLEVLTRSPAHFAGSEAPPEISVEPVLEADAALAVVAHGLLGSLACVANALDRLQALDGVVPVAEFRALTGVMHTQLDHATATLKDIISGSPPDVVKALDDLAKR